MQTQLIAAAIFAAAVAPITQAQLLNPSYSTSTLDRWNYPFNGSPGFRFDLPVFGATEIVGFDDHDAQVLVGFDTSGDVTPGLGAGSYRVLGVTLTMTVSNDNGFTYDDTYDPFLTYQALGTPDTDDGRPINVFLTGYKDGIDQSTFGENSPFGFTFDVEPAQGLRNAFAAIFDDDGTFVNISNNVKESFEAVPLAIGVTQDVTPGDLVPSDTTFTFTFSPCSVGTADELARMLDFGELRLSVTSLAPASGGPDGGAGNYPIFYSRENPIASILGYTPTLELRVLVGNPADLNGDGTLNFGDVTAFLTAYANSDPLADLNSDCAFNFGDVTAFLTAYATQ